MHGVAALPTLLGDPALSPEAIADRAERLLGDADAVAELVRPALARLAADPWWQPEFKASRDPARTGLVLFESPGVQLTAVLLSAAALAALPPPTSVIVTGRLAVTRYHRTGGARLTRWAAGPVDGGFSSATAPPAREGARERLEDGTVLRIDGRREGVVLTPGDGDVLTISATIFAGSAPFMREYARDDGRLLRVATLDGGAARSEMLLSLLRASGRSDAAPVFEAATRDPAFFLRWSAMREWLATDARAALPRLADMADGDPHPEVQAAARSTRAMLTETFACHG